MNPSSSSEPAQQVLAIIDSSVVYRNLIEEHPELLALLCRAAEAATGPDHARLLESLTLATSACDKAVDAMCSGDAAELAKWRRISGSACEDLGRVLKQLCPEATPIGGAASSSPAMN